MDTVQDQLADRRATVVRPPRVLESIKAGKRLPEARFANLKIAARAQQSVLGAFSKADGSAQQPAVATPPELTHTAPLG